VSNPLIIAVGKAVQKVARLRGGGSALPGLVVEKIDPKFAVDLLAQLPMGVVLITGTNGKTTTVKAVTELLAAQGLKVFTNNTGSNFMRGVISSLLTAVPLSGKLNADIAVLELDEAHAVSFVETIKPRYSLLLNVMRDQLDRFGEIDYTARLLTVVARNTTEVVVINREDSRLAAIPDNEALKAKINWFGLTPELKHYFPEDDELYDDDVSESELKAVVLSDSSCRPADNSNPVLLISFEDNRASFEVDGQSYSTVLALKGIYNVFNASAALAIVHAILPDTPASNLVDALAKVTSAFGRGEEIEVDGQIVELILIKNPGGFRLALESHDASGHATMIAINDDYADGRDMSWLFDVKFGALRQTGVAMVSGVRAYDMALRLQYDEVAFDSVEKNLHVALDAFLSGNTDKPRRIYCTYTAMLDLRRQLSHLADVERVI
jgi:UDP-N-acetylmuramyl tripeptide synthase